MSILKKALGFITGGSKIVDRLTDKFLPETMTDMEKSTLRMKMQELEHEREIEIINLMNQADEEFNSRLKSMEGTARDLKAMGWIGRPIIFLRGVQRPLWGFGTMWGDFMWFSGEWGILTQNQESALWVINILVLGFLFGERAIKNLAPIIEKVFAK